MQGIHLHTKFHVNVFWTNFDIGRGSCTDPLLPMRSKFSAACARADPWCTLRAMQISSRSVMSPSGRDKTQTFPFFGLRHFVVSPTAGSLIKLNTGAQLYKPRHQNHLRLHGEIRRTNSDVQKRDEQTHTKTQRFWPLRRRVNSDTHQTCHR